MSLARELVEMLDATRRAERDVFGALDPSVRDVALPDRDWSPKDHQAHLSAWKGRQADRYEAVRRGTEPRRTPDVETDQINAQLHDTRADWTWEAIAREADEVSRRLNEAVLAADPAALADSELLISSTLGNGPHHALQHFGWLLDGDIGVDADRVMAFVRELDELVRRGTLPERHRTDAFYNIACWYAVAGLHDAARPLLRLVLPVRPDLMDWAQQDPDLAALRGELADLAGQ